MKALLGLVLLALPLAIAADTVKPIESVETFVNIRLDPEAGTEIVGRLTRGDELVFIRTVDGWHEIELPGGGTGFIHADWATVVSDEPEQVEEVVVEETPEPIEDVVEEDVEDVDRVYSVEDILEFISELIHPPLLHRFPKHHQQDCGLSMQPIFGLIKHD